eukprot:11111954-Karenia_brevis.AAC.1
MIDSLRSSRREKWAPPPKVPTQNRVTNRSLNLGKHFRGGCSDSCCREEKQIQAIEVCSPGPEKWIQAVETGKQDGNNFERKMRLNFQVAQ